MSEPRRVRLRGPVDVPGFRRAVRWLVAQQVAPEDVRFEVPGAGTADLFDDDALVHDPHGWPEHELAPLVLPAGFVRLCETVLMHDDPGRFVALYTFVRRLVHDRGTWADTLDPARVQLERMARAVQREAHKTKAFVRFRPVHDEQLPDGVRHVAWFEPAHHVVDAVGPFFVRRFTHMDWALLTPRGSLHWDRHHLHRGPPASPADAPAADDGEALWLAYYRSIFNPARVKTAMMKREMPVRFWKHLPETVQVSRLIAEAPQRTGTMVEAPPSQRQRRRGQAVQSVQSVQSVHCLDTARAVQGSPSATVLHAAEPSPTSLPPADGATRLAQVAAGIASCEACPIGCHATQAVMGEGPVGAALMLVGEQPGDREDLEGRPFVGPAGRLLRSTTAALGWPMERVYVTNAVKHFKFEWRGKRRLHKTAAQREAEACEAWLDAEVDAVAPRALVALGATAARSLLGREVRVGEHAGRWLVGRHGRPVLVVAHPSSLLRTDGARQAEAIERWQAQLAAAGTCFDDATVAPDVQAAADRSASSSATADGSTVGIRDTPSRSSTIDAPASRSSPASSERWQRETSSQ